MLVPREIKILIRRCAKQYEQAREKHTALNSWLLSKGIDIDRDEDQLLQDMIIDCMEISYDPQGLIRFMEISSEKGVNSNA